MLGLGLGLGLTKGGVRENPTLHGFEYTPNQNDDRVNLIGSEYLNNLKPIQNSMYPFEEYIATKQRFQLKTDVRQRISLHQHKRINL